MTAPADLHRIAEAVVDLAHQCGYVDVSRNPPVIELGALRTFAVIKMRRRSVELRLLMPTGRRIPGLVRLLTGNAETRTHVIRLRHTVDIDDELTAWLCEAHAAAQQPTDA